MFNKNNQRFFLPLWRKGRLLFFTNYTEKAAMRQSYIVAAATQAGQTEVTRTQLAPVSPEELEKCQNIANSGPELQKFFAAMGGGNLEHFANQLEPSNPFFTPENDRLIYICLCLDLLRRYIVDEQIIKMYEATPKASTLDAEKSHGILKILSARLEPNRAAKIFDSDLEIFNARPFSSLAAANFLRAGAMAKSESGDPESAETAMLRAVNLQESEDKWRRLAEFATTSGKDATAIGYYNTAHALSPLPPASALMMAKLLVKTRKTDDLPPFLETVEKSFPEAAEAIRQKIGRT